MPDVGVPFGTPGRACTRRRPCGAVVQEFSSSRRRERSRSPGLSAFTAHEIQLGTRPLSARKPRGRRARITAAAGAYPMATRRCRCSARTRRVSAPPRRWAARLQRAPEENATSDADESDVPSKRWPNPGHDRSRSARHPLETSELEKHAGRASPLDDPPKDGADAARTHKPTTKQPFENLLSENKRTVNLFLRSLLLG